jgi:hypothetical protein
VSDNLPATKKFRRQIPKEHQATLDTRIHWLWHQRFGTVQTIFLHSRDLLDRTAATLFLQAVIHKDLESINQIFTRIEGGTLTDDKVAEGEVIRY